MTKRELFNAVRLLRLAAEEALAHGFGDHGTEWCSCCRGRQAGGYKSCCACRAYLNLNRAWTLTEPHGDESVALADD